MVFKSLPLHHAMLGPVYARILPRLGYQISWVVAHDVTARRDKNQYAWDDSEVFSVPRWKEPKGKVALFLFDIGTQLRVAFHAMLNLKKGRFDVVQVRNDILLGLLCIALARFYGCRFVYQISYPFPESLIEQAEIRTGKASLLRRVFAGAQIYLRGQIIRHADLVLTISDEMKRRFQNEGVDKGKLFSFPLGTSCPRIPKEKEIAALRATHPFLCRNSKLVLYFGAIQRVRQLDFLLSVASRVCVAEPDIKWLLIGPGPHDEIKRLQALRDKLGISENVFFLGKVPRNEINRYLRLAILSVSPIPPTETYLVSSPTKVVESLALACPVVGTPIPDQAELIKRSGGGLLSHFEQGMFSASVLELVQHPDRAKEMGKAGMDYVRRKRSYQALANVLDERYKLLLAVK